MSYDTLIDELLPHALGHRVALENTIALTIDCVAKGVPGDYVECGVGSGVHPALMARVLLDHDSDAIVHLFDSFRGIPHAGPNDDWTITDCIGPARDGALVSSGVTVVMQWQVKDLLIAKGLPVPGPFRFHEGWFQDTLPVTPIDRVALLRLDGDLYESTRVCLEHLGDKVSSGGFIVVDDYDLTGCKLATDEWLESRGLKPQMQTLDGQHGPVFWEVA